MLLQLRIHYSFGVSLNPKIVFVAMYRVGIMEICPKISLKTSLTSPS